MADPAQDWPSNELEEALERAGKDPSHAGSFYRILRGSKLFVVSPDAEHLQDGVLAADTALRVPTVQIDGIGVPAAFTSEVLARRAIEGSSGLWCVGFNSVALLGFLGANGLALNPNGPWGKHLTREEIAAIVNGTLGDESGGMVSETLPRSTRLQFAPPPEPPPELADAIARWAKSDRRLRRVSVTAIRLPNEDPKLGILVRYSADPGLMVPGLEAHVRPVLESLGARYVVLPEENLGGPLPDAVRRDVFRRWLPF